MELKVNIIELLTDVETIRNVNERVILKQSFRENK